MTTVGELVNALLGGVEGNRGWRTPPLNPIDMFAVSASLLKRSGAYQHVLPSPGVANSGTALLISKGKQDQVARVANLWNHSDMRSVPKQVSTWWDELYESFGEKIYLREKEKPPHQPFPDWWTTALLLMLAADSACDGLGFDERHASDKEDPKRARETWNSYFERTLASVENRSPASLSRVSVDLHCVLPKSRTPNVGATLRSLSHHLALLPPEGIAAARWINRGDQVEPTKPLNLLLVPYPYSISASCFAPTDIHGKSENWGSFHVNQSWLPNSAMGENRFMHFIVELIETACRDVAKVDAVVLPELALNGTYFGRLSKTLQESSQLEFLVSGVSENNDLQKGNYVATTYYHSRVGEQGANQTVLRNERARTERIRAKHHRWKLDEQQIKRYALSSALDPSKNWWESFNIEDREVHIVRFRRNSTLATLICEDLARVDPCQELIRATGPNLVLVLLMDGPQLKARWPARYASVLADDPGSSVLTLTSLGLINRQRLSSGDCPAAIGLWKDNRSDARELVMPAGYQAVVLTLNPHEERTITMDGRQRTNSISWRLGGVQPVRLDNPAAFQDIVVGSL